MSTEALISSVLQGPLDDRIASLHALLDDATIEASSRPLGIKEAASLVALSPHTLRYYEREGLVLPERHGAGHRQYLPVHLRRLVFISRLRVSGMGMADLKHYIHLVDGGPATRPERREMMLAQHARISAQLAEVQLALAATEYKILSYGGAPTDLPPRPENGTARIS